LKKQEEGKERLQKVKVCNVNRETEKQDEKGERKKEITTLHMAEMTS
jgi:hypothetical protein